MHVTVNALQIKYMYNTDAGCFHDYEQHGQQSQLENWESSDPNL